MHVRRASHMTIRIWRYRENANDLMTSPACAPNRHVRASTGLGRKTCLTRAEEAESVSSARMEASSTASTTDRELGRIIGKHDILRPPMPSEWTGDPRTWLSNVDIDAVMYQYARLTKNFVYFGTWPTDFAERAKAGGRCVNVCTPDPFADVHRSNALAASIINLDVHTGGGTHWVAFVLDCRTPGRPRMYYYDPTGRPPPERWMRKSAWAVIVACSPDVATRRYLLENAAYNRSKHQRKNTECGVFSMMFVDAMISGRSFEEHCASTLTDDDAFAKRRVFFDFPSASDERRDSVWSWSTLLRR